MIDRRQALMGLSAALVVPALPAMASSATRRFDLFRGDSRIGEQKLSVSRNGDRVDVSIDIDIKVRILGLNAFSYALQSRETWDGGVLQSLEGRTNDNGSRDYVNARRAGSIIEVDGSGFSGRVDGMAGTTTYWTQAFLARRTWISTQEGTPLSVQVRKGATENFPTAGGSVQATRWAVRGDIGKLDLLYDARGEWVGSEFEARGEQARFLMNGRGAAMTPLWVNA